MMKKVKIFTLLGILAFSNFSCEKSEVCKTLAICDLASKIVVPVAGILLGQDLSIVNTVLNIVDSAVDCGTEDAAQSNSEFKPFYRVDANSPWEAVQTNDPDKGIITVAALKAGTEKSQDRKYKFNKAGQYQFRTLADYDTKVNERDENNNKFTAGKSAKQNGNNEFVSEIITVFENPNIPYDPTKPALEVLEIKWIK
jgi:hypothetical protein